VCAFFRMAPERQDGTAALRRAAPPPRRSVQARRARRLARPFGTHRKALTPYTGRTSVPLWACCACAAAHSSTVTATASAPAPRRAGGVRPAPPRARRPAAARRGAARAPARRARVHPVGGVAGGIVSCRRGARGAARRARSSAARRQPRRRAQHVSGPTRRTAGRRGSCCSLTRQPPLWCEAQLNVGPPELAAAVTRPAAAQEQRTAAAKPAGSWPAAATQRLRRACEKGKKGKGGEQSSADDAATEAKNARHNNTQQGVRRRPKQAESVRRP
jgi:hypothetical protein